MPPPIDSPSYDHLTIQESTGVARTQSSPSGLAAVSYSSAGEWIRATCIAKALKRGLTVVLLMMIFSALISASISLVVKSAHTNYVYAGAIQLILGGISLGFVGPSTERSHFTNHLADHNGIRLRDHNAHSHQHGGLRHLGPRDRARKSR